MQGRLEHKASSAEFSTAWSHASTASVGLHFQNKLFKWTHRGALTSLGKLASNGA